MKASARMALSSTRPFPYPYFTRMPREDVDAIYEYLRTIEPVRSGRRAGGGTAGALAHPRGGARVETSSTSTRVSSSPTRRRREEWNRGAYLVRGPGHCAACHTEKTLTGGDFVRRGPAWRHAGELVRPPTSAVASMAASPIGAKRTSSNFLGTGRASHTMAMSRMGESPSGTRPSTCWREDLQGPSAVYLKDLDDEQRETFDPPDDGIRQTGESIFFLDNCAACHRSDGAGVDHIFARLDGSNKINSDDPTTIIRVVLEGARAEPTERWPHGLAMPAFSWKLTDEQIADVIELRGGTPGATMPASSTPRK